MNTTKHTCTYSAKTARCVTCSAPRPDATTDQEQAMTTTPVIHTAQDAHTVTALVTYPAADGRDHTERVAVYLANVLQDAGLFSEMGGPDLPAPAPAYKVTAFHAGSRYADTTLEGLPFDQAMERAKDLVDRAGLYLVTVTTPARIGPAVVGQWLAGRRIDNLV